MEAFRKKNVLLTRGRFQPFTSLHNDMLAGAAQQFFCEPATDSDDPDECVYREDTLVVLEMTTRDMMDVRRCAVLRCTCLPLSLRSQHACFGGVCDRSARCSVVPVRPAAPVLVLCNAVLLPIRRTVSCVCTLTEAALTRAVAHLVGRPQSLPSGVQGGDLLDWTSNAGINEAAFLQRIEALSKMGYSVLLCAPHLRPCAVLVGQMFVPARGRKHDAGADAASLLRRWARPAAAIGAASAGGRGRGGRGERTRGA